MLEALRIPANTENMQYKYCGTSKHNTQRHRHCPSNPLVICLELRLYTNTLPVIMGVIMGVLHFADHPDNVTDPSDLHSSSMIPVFDVNGPGIVDPEYSPSTLVSEQSMVVQFLTVTKSYSSSVSNELNTNVTELAPLGAMMPDIVSLFW